MVKRRNTVHLFTFVAVLHFIHRSSITFHTHLGRYQTIIDLNWPQKIANIEIEWGAFCSKYLAWRDYSCPWWCWTDPKNYQNWYTVVPVIRGHPSRCPYIGGVPSSEGHCNDKGKNGSWKMPCWHHRWLNLGSPRRRDHCNKISVTWLQGTAYWSSVQ
jgi:hypothetical protein